MQASGVHLKHSTMKGLQTVATNKSDATVKSAQGEKDETGKSATDEVASRAD